MHIDSFSGDAANLPKGSRTADNVLRALATNERVSCWDMDQAWLRNCLKQLQQDGMIVEDKSEPYPWLRFKLTSRAHPDKRSQPQGARDD